MIETVTLFVVLPAVGLAFVLAGVRALRGPSLADRVLAVDLATTVLVGGVVGLALLTHQAVLLDVALVVADPAGQEAVQRWVLTVAPSERDLEEHDLSELAAGVSDPALRARLTEALAEVAMADGVVQPNEVAVIKYFCAAWGTRPPAIEGVDWSEVSLPEEGGAW